MKELIIYINELDAYSISINVDGNIQWICTIDCRNNILDCDDDIRNKYIAKMYKDLNFVDKLKEKK